VLLSHPSLSTTGASGAAPYWVKIVRAGNTVQESVQVCKWLIEAGVDAIHVSTGSSFPHPRNPAGSDLDVDLLSQTYDQLANSGLHTFRNLLLFRNDLTGKLFRKQWLDAGVPASEIEGLSLNDARTIKQAVSVPVICTGGFQTASVIRKAITDGDCDAVSIARPLVANNDQVAQFAAGRDRAERPCTYCNRCLLQVVESPLGCYEEQRFPSRDAMLREVMSVFQPPPFQ